MTLKKIKQILGILIRMLYIDLVMIGTIVLSLVAVSMVGTLAVISYVELTEALSELSTTVT